MIILEVGVSRDACERGNEDTKTVAVPMRPRSVISSLHDCVGKANDGNNARCGD